MIKMPSKDEAVSSNSRTTKRKKQTTRNDQDIVGGRYKFQILSRPELIVCAVTE
jgi:hypothetical protein